jgi:hypothetical protein
MKEKTIGRMSAVVLHLQKTENTGTELSKGKLNKRLQICTTANKDGNRNYYLHGLLSIAGL